MKYSSLNRLSDFEFHDTKFKFESCSNNTLCIIATHLNIHKNAPENPFDCDMEIKIAKMSFQNIKVNSLEPFRTYKTDNEGNWYTDDPLIIFRDSEAEKHLISALEEGFPIYFLETSNADDGTTIKFSAAFPADFTAVCSFDNVLIEWDEYCKKAWYELYKQYKYEVLLDTPNGEQKTTLHIICHDEDVYYKGELQKAPVITVGIKYQEKEIWGRADNNLWTYAFADLQKQLPDGVILKCCMTCKHGNMCPAENAPGELFCTKDVKIKEKSDLLFYTENDSERESRIHNYVQNCKDYCPQSPDC